MRELGKSFIHEDVVRADILLTHTHWDHINGFPFFAPAYRPDRTFRVMAGHLEKVGGVRAVLDGQMAKPMFPVPLGELHANLAFEDFRAGDQLTLGKVRVRTTTLNHPDGATGYRLEYGGKALCYVTDTEHIPGKPDQNILGLIEGADVVIYDSTYTDDEFPSHVGWGHSTWQEGVRLCREAEAKQLVIFHHDPDHDDEFMEKVEDDARKLWKGSTVAREHMRIDLA
jgi:phosphoribosyl 1,2-cyclic phosphodiesterase